MIILSAKKDNLSCLLNLNKQLEPFPEPVRLQPEVAIQISVETYNDFLTSLSKKNQGVVLLSGMQSALLTEDSSQQLYRAYLKDVAGAIFKEISFAEEYDDYATCILPISQNPQLTLTRSLVDAYVQLNFTFVEESVRRDLSAIGLILPHKISEKNINFFNLGLVLYYLAQRQKACSEVSCLCTDYVKT